MLARFDDRRDRRAPDLVLWQVGTNSVLRDHPLDARANAAARGHRAAEGDRRRRRADRSAIRAEGDRQARPPTRMVALLANVAKEEKVDLFHRFAMMRHWHEAEHMPFEAFVSPDGLHMNDWSYACLAKLPRRGDRRGGDAADASAGPAYRALARAHPVIAAWPG